MRAIAFATVTGVSFEMTLEQVDHTSYHQYSNSAPSMNPSINHAN